MAIRNKPLTTYLDRQLQQGVVAVYGKGYKWQNYSGGQRAKGAKGPGGRVGSTRHDLGKASDGYIIDPQGKRLRGDQLAPMAQYWRAKGIGGVGLEMRGGGIHLDQHADRPPSWSYGNMTKAQRAAITAGNAGTFPTGVDGQRLAAQAHGIPLLPGFMTDQQGGRQFTNPLQQLQQTARNQLNPFAIMQQMAHGGARKPTSTPKPQMGHDPTANTMQAMQNAQLPQGGQGTFGQGMTAGKDPIASMFRNIFGG